MNSGNERPADKKQLTLYNSLTRKKETFEPIERKTIKWYCCGPTVYDVAHLGHARCYITFDIIRRILTDYFGYQIFYVMNITDIDDKIIKRARSYHLYDKYVDKLSEDLRQTSANEADKRISLLGQIKVAIDNYKTRRAGEQDKDKLLMFDNIIKNSVSAFEKLENLVVSKEFKQEEFRQSCEPLRDVIADEQDSKLAHTVNDHQIFKKLARNFEQEFWKDMQRLDILPPTALTRVSEYIDEIGDYIKKIEENGYAYRSNGSIYFDTEKFDSADKHSYAKLLRSAYGQKKKLTEGEGEGELSVSHQDEKKSPNDFALWKKSKVGEPSWQTKDFEAGRPGWHIECSAMACKLLGEEIDIHSGGHDLRFPHHDNEIAQAEAYYDTGKNWINYFLHSGHLTISGCKMSKSLKNFVTIEQALGKREYTSRQLRFAFLAHGWTETLDYSPNTMNTALSYEKTFKEFFLNTSDTLRRRVSQLQSQTGAEISTQFNKWSEEDHLLYKEFQTRVSLVDSALCDNLDTRTALNNLSSLVKECNKQPKAEPILLKEIAIYIKHILSIFGTNFDECDFASSGRPNSAKVEQLDLKYVETLAQFRADIRKISKGAMAKKSFQRISNLCNSIRDQILPNLGALLKEQGDASNFVETLTQNIQDIGEICKEANTQEGHQQILKLCDVMRDEILPSLDIRLEDRETSDVPYVVKVVDRETLARERALAEEKKQAKKVNKETRKLDKLKIQQKPPK